MATITKNLLSGSTNGKGILITATTSGSAQNIHTAVAGTSALDEIWLYATNPSTSSTATLNVLWGGTVEQNDVSRTVIPRQSGRYLVCDGRLLNNSLIVKAYADTGSAIVVDGFVNSIV